MSSYSESWKWGDMELQRDFMLEQKKGQMKSSVFETLIMKQSTCRGQVADLWFLIHTSKEQPASLSFRETKILTYKIFQQKFMQ